MKTSKSPITRSSLFGMIFPDEMVWSYYARFLARFPMLTFFGLGALLGGGTPSWSKSFPARLSRLAKVFNFANAPDATGLVYGHSFFPFAVPEITEGKASRLMATLAHQSFPTGAPNHLVLPGSFKLRVCPTCLVEDQGTFGVKYWHRCHQIPLLRICCTHEMALHETDVTAGAQDPVPVTKATVDFVPMEVGDALLQRILAKAYGSLARCGNIPSGGQVHDELGRTLGRHGCYQNRRVDPSLTVRIKALFGQDALKLVGISEHEVGLNAWCRVPKLALIIYALGESFDAFLRQATDIAPVEHWMRRYLKTMERDRQLAAKVRQFAPEIVTRLRETARCRISAWAIAKELNPILGAGFASNWSYRTFVKEALAEAEEQEAGFHLRMLEFMRRQPEALRSHLSVIACARAFGLGKAIERDEGLKEEVRHLFLSARAGAPK